MVWPSQANYSKSLLRYEDSDNGNLWVSHKALGSGRWKYSFDFGSSYSHWMPYNESDVLVPAKNWTGTKSQAWEGEHIIVQYWNRATGSSNHYQYGDVGWDKKPPRRFPHMYVEGDFNLYGYDSGYRNQMHLNNVSGQ